MKESSVPPFLYPPGSPLMHPPLALSAARMYGFWVEGGRSRLQASVNATLNAASGGRMHFEVVSPYVLLTFTEIGHANSTNPVDQAKGWGKETDIVTWVFVACTETGKSLPSAFYAYPLHIWVDDCMALINGRELFGYPKYECSYTMPAADADVTGFSLAAKGFQPFSEQTELAMHRLLAVDAVDSSLQVERFQDPDVWRSRQLQALRELPDFWAADPSWQTDFERWFAFPPLDQIFLKQFPDASGEYAVYQALVAAPAAVKSISGLWLLPDTYQLSLHEFASFPLHYTLGWALGDQAAHVGFRVDFDFEVGSGKVLFDNTHSQGAAR